MAVTRAARNSAQALDQVQASVPAGHLLAVAGTPGSGRKTLLALLSGRVQPDRGSLTLHGRDLLDAQARNRVAQVPVSDAVLIACLTAKETLLNALRLRVAGLNEAQMAERAVALLTRVGLQTVIDQRVAELGPQRRLRLKLALALVADPVLLVCEVGTEAMDPRLAVEWLELLREVVSDRSERIVVTVVSHESYFPVCDSVLLLHEGQAIFHGPAKALPHYFSLESVAELQLRLAQRSAAHWSEAWSRHRDSYYEAFKLADVANQKEQATSASDSSNTQLPAFRDQVRALLKRRWTSFLRCRREWLPQALLLVGAPASTLLMGLPNAPFLKQGKAGVEDPAVLWPAAYTWAMIWLVQVVWMLIFAVRNGSREIAGERDRWEYERANGLRLSAYLFAKLGFVLPLVVLQSLLLGLIVEAAFSGLPGSVGVRLVLLLLTGLAFSWLCLGISAWHDCPERARGRAWALMFANLLLAGALLGFPRAFGVVVQPLVTAYYGWSGGVETLIGTALFPPITQFVRTWFAAPGLAVFALLAHVAAGVVLAGFGLRRLNRDA